MDHHSPTAGDGERSPVEDIRMRLVINRFAAQFFTVLIYPMVLVIRLIRFLAGYRKPAYKSTIHGAPLTFAATINRILVPIS